MSLDDYLTIASTVYARTPDWRMGQTYFNTLAEARPGLAERVRGSSVDPFRNDERIGDFLTFISDNWDAA